MNKTCYPFVSPIENVLMWAFASRTAAHDADANNIDVYVG